MLYFGDATRLLSPAGDFWLLFGHVRHHSLCKTQHGRQHGLTGSTCRPFDDLCRPFDDLCRPDIVDTSRVPDFNSFDLRETLNIVNFSETFDTLDNERSQLRGMRWLLRDEKGHY